MTRRAGWLLAEFAALAVLVTAGTGSAAKPQRIVVEKAPVLPARATDGHGKQVTVRDVSRIVSLNGDITETIVTLGLAKNLAGVDISATYPEKLVAGIQKVGYQRTLAAEGILSLRPSLVIGTSTAGPVSTIEQLRSAGVPVLIIPEHKGLDAGARKLRAVGRALGVPKRGEKLARQVETQIALARREVARAATKPKVAFLYVRGTQVQQIGGVGSGADAMIEAAGGVDVGTTIGIQGFKQLTAESLVAARATSRFARAICVSTCRASFSPRFGTPSARPTARSLRAPASRSLYSGMMSTGTPALRSCSMVDAGPAVGVPITSEGLSDRIPSAASVRW